MIFWNGVSSDDVRVIVEHYPARPIPRRKLDIESIPGRSGDVIHSQDAWENAVQRYDVYLSAEREKLPRVARAAAEWLCVPGYRRLEDDYDPDVFRLAYFAGGQEIANILNLFGRATLEFGCKPQRFLKAGERVHTFASSGVLVNPTLMTALPLVRVYGTGTVTVGGTSVTITQNPGYIDLDCEIMDAFFGSVNCNGYVQLADFPAFGSVNCNGYVQLADFPALRAGENAITLGSGITRVEITPRWWTL